MFCFYSGIKEGKLFQNAQGKVWFGITEFMKENAKLFESSSFCGPCLTQCFSENAVPCLPCTGPTRMSLLTSVIAMELLLTGLGLLALQNLSVLPPCCFKSIGKNYQSSEKSFYVYPGYQMSTQLTKWPAGCKYEISHGDYKNLQLSVKMRMSPMGVKVKCED